MIITTVGNNFGANQVELKIFQNDNYIIVNAPSRLIEIRMNTYQQMFLKYMFRT